MTVEGCGVGWGAGRGKSSGDVPIFCKYSRSRFLPDMTGTYYYSFRKHLPGTYVAPGTTLNIKNTEVNEA